MRNRSIFTGTALSAIALRAHAGATAATVAPAFTAVGSLPMPESKTRRGSVSIYPFDTLTSVGQAFGVTNKSKKQLASVISNANKKNLVNKVDANGATVFETSKLTDPTTGAETVIPTDKPVKVKAKQFAAFDVTDDYRKANKDAFAKGGPFEGATALVFRVEPTA